MPSPPEILAPAGGREPFLAALNAGADAVYLGLQAFNARVGADNFTLEDLEELLPLARRYGMRVLVTVNTLLAEGELPAAMELLVALDTLRVDGIIVQDPGVVRMAQREFPALALHASTQMAIHSARGVEQAEAMGFKRIVLARELTLEEIDGIAREFPGVELEVFCHGSLCTSYSGLCLLSSMESGHSGNRGRCRYPCRRPYRVEGDGAAATDRETRGDHLLSMRDLELPTPLLARLVETGIHALKIEGRKKDAQYVQTVVRLYRQRLDQVFGGSTLRASAPPAARQSTPSDLENDLAYGFRRRPTQLYLAGRRRRCLDPAHPTHMGIVVGPIRTVKGRRIRLTPSVPLERYDGLRLEQGKDGFSLRRMWVVGRSVPVARSGREVEIEVPDDVPLPHPDTQLLKVRSADLKRRTAALSVVPQGARLRRIRPVDGVVELHAEGGELTIVVRLTVGSQGLVEEHLITAAERPRGPSSLAADLHKLALFGKAGFRIEDLEIRGDHDWFVPRRRIKELKARLAQALPAAYARWREARLDRALESLDRAADGLTEGTAVFHVRLDTVEGLHSLEAFLTAHPDSPAGEVIVAPRADRGAFAPAEPWIDAWKACPTVHERPLRLALPAVVRADEEPGLERWLGAFAGAGLAGRYELANLASFTQLAGLGLPMAEQGALTGAATLNALNHEAAALLAGLGIHRVALPLEADRSNLRDLLRRWPTAGIRPQAELFADPPLLTTEACPLAEVDSGCPGPEACDMRDLTLVDGDHRYTLSHQRCRGVLRDARPFSIAHLRGELAQLGVRDFAVELTGRHGSPDHTEAILTACLQGQAIPDTHSGNMARKLL